MMPVYVRQHRLRNSTARVKGLRGLLVPRRPVGHVHGAGFTMAPGNRRRAGTRGKGAESPSEPARTRRGRRSHAGGGRAGCLLRLPRGFSTVTVVT